MSLTLIPASAKLPAMTSLHQSGLGMPSAHAGRYRPEGNGGSVLSGVAPRLLFCRNFARRSVQSPYDFDRLTMLRKTLNRIAVSMAGCMLWSAAFGPEARADTNAHPNASVAGLIRDLGDARRETRKAAADGLRHLGYAALAALETAAKSDDPEVATTARAILADARLGITPDWPPALASRVRGLDTLPARDRLTAIQDVLADRKDDAAPFLQARLKLGSPEESAVIYEHVKASGSAPLAQRITESRSAPLTAGEQRVLAWAWLRLDKPKDALSALAPGNADEALRQDISSKAVQNLLKLREQRRFKALLAEATDYTAAASNDARFLYLGAMALDALDQKEDAGQWTRKALALNPNDEAPHYTVADMLEDLSLPELAIGEWERILAIPPVDDVYDINAHLRLGKILAARKQYAEAATHYKSALATYRKRRGAGGAGYGMIGSSEADLEATIQKLEQQAQTPRNDSRDL